VLEPSVYTGLRARRDVSAPNGVRFLNTYEIYSDSKQPADDLRYVKGELDSVLLWGATSKQLRSFAVYLFGKGDLAVADKPLRHDPRVTLFSSLA
jgi:hypothetical protein